MYVTVHSEFHNDTVCLIAGLGVFAGRDFKEGETVLRSWGAAFFPKGLPAHLPPYYYVFHADDTQDALHLGYGSITNHHDFYNVGYIWDADSDRGLMFVVRELLHVHV